MANLDPTDMGGVRETFLTTHWSLVEGVRERQDKDQALIGLLLERYWKPVYCCLRRKGYGNEQAKDLTQGFFHEVVLNRKLVERADPSKGRFRSFLLHALGQYLLDEQRRDAAQKRIPRSKLVPLDIADPPSLPQTTQELDAEACFNYAWKVDLLDRVLTELREWYVGQGMEVCCLRRNWTFPDCVLVSTVGSHSLKGNVHDHTTTVFRPGESPNSPAPPVGAQTHLGGLRAVSAQSQRLLPLAKRSV